MVWTAQLTKEEHVVTIDITEASVLDGCVCFKLQGKEMHKRSEMVVIVTSTVWRW